jgi:hypothetical protein
MGAHLQRSVELLSLLSMILITASCGNTISPNSTLDPMLVLKGDVVEYSIRTPIQRRNLKLAPSGNEYYVSVQGSDQNPGTKEQPFRHIQRFADIARPGDICLVREGTYRETVRPKNGGRIGDPIRYVAYPGEKVTLSGTEPITGQWSVYKGVRFDYIP